MLDRLREAIGVLWREIAKFGIVGAVAFVVDLGGFNLLSSGPLEDKVTTAKIVSGAVATLVAWIGNRWWTFRHRRSRPVAHEVTLFFGINGVALGITAVWVAISHYVLGMDGTLALNINACIGIALGTLFRFWAYRRLVFVHEHPGDPEEGHASAGDASSPGTGAASAADRNSANRAG